MIAEGYIEDLIRWGNGGIITDEDRFESEWVLAMLNEYRIKALQIEWGAGRMQYEEFLQVATCTNPVDVLDYESKIIGRRFPCTPAASLDTRFNGYSWCGNKIGCNDYQVKRSKGSVRAIQSHRYMSSIPLAFANSNGDIEEYNNLNLETLYVELLARNPAKVPGFDIEVDDYPMNDGLMVVIKKMMLSDIALITGKPIDTISNSADNSNILHWLKNKMISQA